MLEIILKRLAAVERLAAVQPKQGLHGKHGKHGRDGKDGVGIPGRDGRDGRDADPKHVERVVTELVAQFPKPKDGKDGENVPVEVVRELVNQVTVAEVLARVRTPLDGKQGNRGVKGDRGPPGEPGPIGPMPRHEWSGTKLRFEMQPGEWGKYVDLEGPAGKPGKNGRNGGTTFISGGGGGGGGGSASSVFGYFPQGWT